MWPPPGGWRSNAAACSTPPSTSNGLNEFAPLTKAASELLQRELERGRLTARGLHRVRRVSRTLADLDGSPSADRRDVRDHGARHARPHRTERRRAGGVSADDRAALVALATLPSMGPETTALDPRALPPGRSLRAAGGGAPARRLRSKPSELAPTVRPAAGPGSGRSNPNECSSELRRARDRVVTVHGDPDYPAVLSTIPIPPAVLFVRGRLDVLDARRVAIVGTRNATAAGRATAFELGEALAAHGVAVVSGLARGIDGAAHRGVRSAGGRAVAVVGNGLDRPYPKQNADLWEWVADNGLLVSEWPPGTQPDAWRFPLRNRIIAALSEVLVVVESRESGGSLITADGRRRPRRHRDGGSRLDTEPRSARAPTSCSSTAPRRSRASTTCWSRSVSTTAVRRGRPESASARRRQASPLTCSSSAPNDRCTLDTIAEQLGISVHRCGGRGAHLEAPRAAGRHRRLVRIGPRRS